MGYTHYWKMNRNFTKAEWDILCATAEHIISEAAKEGVYVQYNYNDTSPPLIQAHAIIFNGKGDDGHEAFELTPEATEFTFCKTAYKPYDGIVVSILYAASKLAPGSFEPSSDGGPEAIKPVFGNLPGPKPTVTLTVTVTYDEGTRSDLCAGLERAVQGAIDRGLLTEHDGSSTVDTYSVEVT